MTLRLDWHHQFRFAGYYDAKALDHYEQAGHDMGDRVLAETAQWLRRCVGGQARFFARETGRDRRVHFSASMRKAATERARLTNVLRNALESEELPLELQPIVAQGNGRIVKAQALMRLRPPVDSVIRPAKFIRPASGSPVCGAPASHGRSTTSVPAPLRSPTCRAPPGPGCAQPAPRGGEESLGRPGAFFSGWKTAS